MEFELNSMEVIPVREEQGSTEGNPIKVVPYTNKGQYPNIG